LIMIFIIIITEDLEMSTPLTNQTTALAKVLN